MENEFLVHLGKSAVPAIVTTLYCYSGTRIEDEYGFPVPNVWELINPVDLLCLKSEPALLLWKSKSHFVELVNMMR